MSKSKQSLLHQFFLNLWYEPSLKNRLLSYCFSPLSLLFKSLASIKRSQDTQAAKKLPVPVVVIGNITVGGTGKTPVVIALATALQAQGKSVGIISRGYGGTHSKSEPASPLLVDSQTSVLVSGDESLLIAQETQCPVVIDRDRSRAAEYLLKQFPNTDIIISDDGLQHYKLYRSLEIVVIDNKRGLGNQFCLPAGPLREPVSRLESVDWILLNTQELNSQEADNCEPLKETVSQAFPNGQFQLASVSLQPTQWLNIGLQQHYELQEPSWYQAHIDTGQPKVIAIAAIGNPQRFFDTLNTLAINPQKVAFDDHHSFSSDDFSANARDIVVMTSKDAVKCSGFANEYCWALKVSLQLPQPLISDVLDLIDKPANKT